MPGSSFPEHTNKYSILHVMINVALQKLRAQKTLTFAQDFAI